MFFIIMLLVQVLNKEFLLNLCDRLTFEIEIRYFVYDGCEKKEEDQLYQPMYIFPMWNIVEKIKQFEKYFEEFNLKFPVEDIYKHPFDFNKIIPQSMIHSKEEEFIFNGEIIKIHYNYLI